MTKEERKARFDEIKLHRLAIAKLRNETLLTTILRRLLGLIPITLTFLFTSVYYFIESVIMYCLYGGEVIVYNKYTRKTINDVFKMLYVKKE